MRWRVAPARWRSATRPLRQKGTPALPRMLVRTRAGLEARARPAATPASDSARPEGKWAPHTAARARTESPEVSRAARVSLADSTTSIVLTVARFDRFAPRSAAVRQPAWFW